MDNKTEEAKYVTGFSWLKDDEMDARMLDTWRGTADDGRSNNKVEWCRRPDGPKTNTGSLMDASMLDTWKRATDGRSNVEYCRRPDGPKTNTSSLQITSDHVNECPSFHADTHYFTSSLLDLNFKPRLNKLGGQMRQGFSRCKMIKKDYLRKTNTGSFKVSKHNKRYVVNRINMTNIIRPPFNYFSNIPRLTNVITTDNQAVGPSVDQPPAFLSPLENNKMPKVSWTNLTMGAPTGQEHTTRGTLTLPDNSQMVMVNIKVYQDPKTLVTEAQTLLDLKKTWAVPVLYGLTQEPPWALVTAVSPGVTLEQFLKNSLMPKREAMINRAQKLLKKVHAKGYVHLGITDKNIMVHENGLVKMIHFTDIDQLSKTQDLTVGLQKENETFCNLISRWVKHPSPGPPKKLPTKKAHKYHGY